jgi:multidrug efflux pump subunit AcrA (membrane-fusion protein)
MTRTVLKQSHRAVTIFIATAVAALAGFAFASGDEPKQSAPAATRPALTVRATTLQAERWLRSLSATGSIVPWQEAVISAQLQGLRIADVRVSIGDAVQQGDILVTLDNVAGGGDGARVVQGRIVAPDSGVISAANATVGSLLQPGAELFRLIRKGRLEWRPDLTADELMLLRRGMAVKITVGEGRVITGTVRAISPTVNPQTRLGFALVSLPDSTGLVAGAFARGTFDISGGKRPLMSLPQVAVMQRAGQAFVLVIGADNRVHERAVVEGQRNGDRVEIKSGLKPGESVVESGAAFLTDGDVVQVIKN